MESKATQTQARIWAVLAPALVALLCGIAYAVWEDHNLNRSNSYKIEAISDDIADIRVDLREKTIHFFTRKEADLIHQRQRGRLDDHEARLRMLERQRPLITRSD